MSKKFIEFLTKSGAEILETTNPWEVARFKTANGVCVVYSNSKGRITYSNKYAQEAYAAFVDDRPWIAVSKKERIKRKSVEQILLERDGSKCFYCGGEFRDDTPPTLEHFLSIANGGGDHLSNLALACEACNQEAGNLAIVDKIKLRRMQ